MHDTDFFHERSELSKSDRENGLLYLELAHWVG